MRSPPQQYSQRLSRGMKVVLILCLVLALVLSQIGEDPNVDIEEAREEPTKEDLQRYYSMRRTACIVLSRHFVNSRKDDVEGVFNELSPDQQPNFANKLYATGVELCEEQISPNQVQELFIENASFDPSVFFPIFDTLDIVGLSKNALKLSKAQEHIAQSIKQFDDDMAIRKEEQESEEDKQNDDKYDIKFFNMSTKEMSPLVKTVYALVFLAAVSGLLYWGFKQIDNESPKKKDKRKSRSVSPPKRA